MEFNNVCTVRGQARPRFTRNGTCYKPSADSSYESGIAAAYLAAGGKNLGNVPIAVRIDVFRRLPKNAPKKANGTPDTIKPDADNIAKSVLDALNGIAWDDDAQVVELTVIKHPRVKQDSDIMTVSVLPASF